MKNPFQIILCVLACLFFIATIGLYIRINYSRNPVSVERGSVFIQSVDGAASYKVNINTADLEQLTDLPQIGPVLAQRILDYRQAHGAFQSITDLMHVSGIGDTRLKLISDYITVE